MFCLHSLIINISIVLIIEREGERETEKERETDRQRKRERDRQTESKTRQKKKKRKRQTDREQDKKEKEIGDLMLLLEQSLERTIGNVLIRCDLLRGPCIIGRERTDRKGLHAEAKKG